MISFPWLVSSGTALRVKEKIVWTESCSIEMLDSSDVSEGRMSAID